MDFYYVYSHGNQTVFRLFDDHLDRCPVYTVHSGFTGNHFLKFNISIGVKEGFLPFCWTCHFPSSQIPESSSVVRDLHVYRGYYGTFVPSILDFTESSTARKWIHPSFINIQGNIMSKVCSWADILVNKMSDTLNSICLRFCVDDVIFKEHLLPKECNCTLQDEKGNFIYPLSFWKGRHTSPFYQENFTPHLGENCL